ncbi:MAG: LemA family protein, partial [Actinomycetota bacterium]
MEWIIIAVVVLLVIVVAAMYNGLVRDRNRVDNAWSQVDVQLERRYDLIPNLVETVKGYATHEQQTFERVTQAR